MAGGKMSLCDGRTLEYDGLSAPLDVTHQYATVQLDEEVSFEVSNGRTIDSYQQQPRPAGWTVEDIERFSYRDGTLGLATLRIEQEPGFPPRILTWIGLELEDGVARTAVQGKDYAGMIRLFDRLIVVSTGSGLRIDSPIVAEPSPPMLVISDDELEAGISISAREYPSAQARVPRNAGRQTRGGMLYRRSDEPNSARILVSRTAVADVVPFHRQSVEEPSHGYRAAENLVLECW